MKTKRISYKTFAAIVLLSTLCLNSCEKEEEVGDWCFYCMHLMVGGDHCAPTYEAGLELAEKLERRGYSCAEPSYQPW